MWCTYGPYIASHMIQVNNITYFDANGLRYKLCKHLRLPPTPVAPSHPPRVVKSANGLLIIGPEHANFFFQYLWEPMARINPCFNPHEVGVLCPAGHDSLGAYPYFKHTDFKRAINFPVDRGWTKCASAYSEKPDSNTVKPAPDQFHLPNVIEHTNNAIIVHRMLDFSSLSTVSCEASRT